MSKSPERSHQNGMDITVGTYGFAIVMPVRQSGLGATNRRRPERARGRRKDHFRDDPREVERDTGVTVEASQLVLDLPGPSPSRRSFPASAAPSSSATPDTCIVRRAAGHEYRHGRCGQSRLETRGGASRAGQRRLLDSYEPERIAFARLLMRVPIAPSRVATSPSRLVGFWRRYMMPRMMAAMLGTRAGSRFSFGPCPRSVSIIVGAQSAEARLARSKRVIDCPCRQLSGRQFPPLKSLDWQVHIYGNTNKAFASDLELHGLSLHVLPWSDAADAVGLTRDAAYLVRPDGHIALATPEQDIGQVARYLLDWESSRSDFAPISMPLSLRKQRDPVRRSNSIQHMFKTATFEARIALRSACPFRKSHPARIRIQG